MMGTKPDTKSDRIYEGKVVNLRIDSFRLANGSEARMEIVEHAEVVHVLPVAEDGKLLLVRQYRAAAGKELLETPAGGIEPGEDPETASQRELREETGYRADDFRLLASVYSSPGFCTELNHLFVATGLSYDPLDPDADEDIALVPVTLPEAEELVTTGGIGDAKSATTILLYKFLNLT